MYCTTHTQKQPCCNKVVTTLTFSRQIPCLLLFEMKTVTALPVQPQRKHGLHVWRVPYIFMTVGLHNGTQILLATTSSTEMAKASLLCSGVLSVSDFNSVF